MNKKHLKFNGFQKICFNVIYSVNYRRSTYGYCSIVRFQFLPLRSDREKRTYMRLFFENEYFGIGGCFFNHYFTCGSNNNFAYNGIQFSYSEIQREKYLVLKTDCLFSTDVHNKVSMLSLFFIVRVKALLHGKASIAILVSCNFLYHDPCQFTH